MAAADEFAVLNLGYIAELYARYRDDPRSVDPATRAQFERWQLGGDGGAVVLDRALEHAPRAAAEWDGRAIAGAVRLAHAIRARGYLEARTNPLAREAPTDAYLDAAAYAVAEDVLRALPAGIVGGLAARDAATAWDAVERLREVYASTVGYEIEHMAPREERTWLRDAIESGRFRVPTDADTGAALLTRLTQVEAFEQFLHRTFPGKTRFSIEGADMLVPMLDELIRLAASDDIRTIQLGMAHRGRLNVMAHIVGKPYAAILAEFKEPLDARPARDDVGWTGDVTYHKGARTDPGMSGPDRVTVTLAPNPSHLEAVDPVVLGMTRAAAARTDQQGAPRWEFGTVLAVLIHGDASFHGQGVVAESLNLSRLRGYEVGGTLHIIVNYQLGYTALPEETHGAPHASDLAKGFGIPVVHVNADDPEECVAAIRLAAAYRQRFHKDALIDLVGYRRYGHNEGDEPTFTQPQMYEAIRRHPTVRALWATTLVARGLIEPAKADAILREHTAALQVVLAGLDPAAFRDAPPPPAPAGAARRVQTAVPEPDLRALYRALAEIPPGFHVHPKLTQAIARRRMAVEGTAPISVDWATAEQLAFATILADGVSLRLTGQDVARGTFSQRHAVLHDVETGSTYVPLQALPQARAAFEVCNTPVTENAALGFEYGYSVAAPGRLVIWEAQYGDFINGAQVVVDEFIASARSKWGQTPSLVLLLPHGAEGQGPDHTSGRLERFLELAAEINLRIANCTTAAQYFHLLRRQAALLRTDPLPLVVMTPKRLLRHSLVSSLLQDLAEGGWQPVLDDAAVRDRPDAVERLVVCSGKIAVDLAESAGRKDHPELAIVRLEQVYPFPEDAVRAVLTRYARVRDMCWVQEEPENMGAWTFVQPLLAAVLGGGRVECLSRAPNASPAEGSHARYAAAQAQLIQQALESRVAGGARPGER
ncbi:MAG TPA: 2-oxoglutarate dehydrogenase E1 component [bacterium]|nr:2-oxoglutarate dehydrogenase E1 component [bacterium]